MIFYRCNVCGKPMHNSTEPANLKARPNDSEVVIFDMISANVRLVTNNGELIRDKNVHVCSICISKALGKYCKERNYT
jgi:hypothetical protein